jgi:hypothetical protein
MLYSGHEKNLIITGLFLFLFLSFSSVLAFQELSLDHWAYQETFQLIEDPGVRDYINGRISAKKPMFKYNFAVILAKFVSPESLESKLSGFGVDKLLSLKRLIKYFDRELVNLDVKTGHIDKLIVSNINRINNSSQMKSDYSSLTIRPLIDLKKDKKIKSEINFQSQDLVNIKISPSFMKMRAGTRQKFRLFGITPANSIIPLTGQWEVTGQGTELSPGGDLFVTKSGPVKVIAYDPGSGLKAAADITVMPDDLSVIRIAPEYVSVIPGQSVSFVVTAYDKYENEVSITPVFKQVGQAGKIENNLFKAAGPGNSTVFVTDHAGKIFAKAKVNVLVPNVRKINNSCADPALVESERILQAKEELLKERIQNMQNIKRGEQNFSGLRNREDIKALAAPKALTDLKASIDPGRSLSARLRSDHASIMNKIKPLSDKEKMDSLASLEDIIKRRSKSSVSSLPGALPCALKEKSESSKNDPSGKPGVKPVCVVKQECLPAPKSLPKSLPKSSFKPAPMPAALPTAISADKPVLSSPGRIGIALTPSEENKRRKAIMLKRIKKEINTIIREKRGLTGLSSFEKIFSDPEFRNSWDTDVIELLTLKGINAVKLAQTGDQDREVRVYILRNTKAADVKSVIASSVFGSSDNCRYHVDDRTNTIVISAPVKTLVLFSKYIRMIDIPRAELKSIKGPESEKKTFSASGRIK